MSNWLEIAPNNYPAKMLLGNIYMYQKNFKEAKNIFESLIKLAPENSEGYLRLGLLQRVLKEYDPALENLNKALSINPKLMDVFTNIILVHAAKNEFETAILKCDKKLEELQDAPELLAIIHNLKGELYLAQHKEKQVPAPLLCAWQNIPYRKKKE